MAHKNHRMGSRASYIMVMIGSPSHLAIRPRHYYFNALNFCSQFTFPRMFPPSHYHCTARISAHCLSFPVCFLLRHYHFPAGNFCSLFTIPCVSSQALPFQCSVFLLTIYLPCVFNPRQYQFNAVYFCSLLTLPSPNKAVQFLSGPVIYPAFCASFLFTVPYIMCARCSGTLHLVFCFFTAISHSLTSTHQPLLYWLLQL